MGRLLIKTGCVPVSILGRAGEGEGRRQDRTHGCRTFVIACAE